MLLLDVVVILNAALLSIHPKIMQVLGLLYLWCCKTSTSTSTLLLVASSSSILMVETTKSKKSVTMKDTTTTEGTVVEYNSGTIFF